MNSPDLSSRAKPRRRATLRRAALAALVVGLLQAAPRPAQAAEPLTVAAVVTYLKQAYDYYKQLRALLGDAGPPLAEQLRAMQDAIIGEMRTQRNMALQSQTRTVFNLFTNLADNAPNDPTNASTWSNVLLEQQRTADAMYDIITAANDPTSSYQLALAYNSLIATGTGVLKIKGQIWPATPSSWNDFYIWLQPGINADYFMIGSQRHQCWPGHNPGYWPPPPPIQITKRMQWEAIMKPGKYRSSQLYAQKLENRSVKVEEYQIFCTFSNFSWSRYCNPAKMTCDPMLPGGCRAEKRWTACNSGETVLDCADRLGKTHFDADGIVQVIREGMRGIQTLSGGNDYDAASNNGLVSQGKLVDPWVDEPSCTNGPWAYPQLP